MKIERLKPIKPNGDPFTDEFPNGTIVGKNVIILHNTKKENDKCNEIIVVDNDTGERVRITFGDQPNSLSKFKDVLFTKEDEKMLDELKEEDLADAW